MWVEGVIWLACVIVLIGVSYFIGREEGCRSMRTNAELLEKIMREDYQLRRELSNLREERRKEREEHYLTD